MWTITNMQHVSGEKSAKMVKKTNKLIKMRKIKINALELAGAKND